MPKRHIRTIVILGLLAVPAGARGDSSRGGSFVTPGFGARAWGMAGAAIATMDDESAVYWNPAMLGALGVQVAGASYVNLVEGATARESQLAWARPLALDDRNNRSTSRHTIGAMLTNLHLGIDGAGSYNENTVRLAWAFTPDPFFTVGVSFDGLFSSSEIDNFDSKGSRVDLGLRAQLTRRATAALVVRNLVSRYSFSDGRDVQTRRSVDVGLAWNKPGLGRVEGDISAEAGDVARVAVGGESRWIAGLFVLRAGYAIERAGESRSIPYFGLGARALDSRIRIHYNANFDGDEALGRTHRFAVSVTL